MCNQRKAHFKKGEFYNGNFRKAARLERLKEELGDLKGYLKGSVTQNLILGPKVKRVCDAQCSAQK